MMDIQVEIDESSSKISNAKRKDLAGPLYLNDGLLVAWGRHVAREKSRVEKLRQPIHELTKSSPAKNVKD